eukprot:c19969_g1_i1.p1 GENE.c19969_g1_i1~~c19969_g1_i1.p1  ORF type:complete len:955 (-),score=268.79 c19969_g1_i1:250-3006(-)
MDAQAQDRCHRIGQTREVHIYRLISDHTVEENILEKANQKRFLTDLVVEGGDFQRLAQGDGNLNKEDVLSIILGEQKKRLAVKAETLETVVGLTTRDGPPKPNDVADILQPTTPKAPTTPKPTAQGKRGRSGTPAEEGSSEKDKEDKEDEGEEGTVNTNPTGDASDFQTAIAAVEDEDDQIGIKAVEREQAEERGEYEFEAGEDDPEPQQQQPQQNIQVGESSSLEQLAALESRLCDVQRYMIRIAEQEYEAEAAEQLEVVKEEVQGQMEMWDLEQLRNIKEMEEHQLSEDEDMLTFTVADQNKTSQEHYQTYYEEVMRMSNENLLNFEAVVPGRRLPRRNDGRAETAEEASEIPDPASLFGMEWDAVRRSSVLDDVRDASDPSALALVLQGEHQPQQQQQQQEGKGLLGHLIRVPAVNFGREWAESVYNTAWRTAVVEGRITSFEKGSMPTADRWVVHFRDDPNEYRFGWRIIKHWVVPDSGQEESVGGSNAGAEGEGENEDDAMSSALCVSSSDEEEEQQQQPSSQDTAPTQPVDEQPRPETSPYHNMRFQRQAALGVGRATEALMAPLVLDGRSPKTKRPRPEGDESDEGRVAKRKATGSKAPQPPLTPQTMTADQMATHSLQRWQEGRGLHAPPTKRAWNAKRVEGVGVGSDAQSPGLFFAKSSKSKLVKKAQKQQPKVKESEDPWCPEEDDVLQAAVAAFGINFDLVASVLNDHFAFISRTRSAKQCQQRYVESVLIPQTDKAAKTPTTPNSRPSTPGEQIQSTGALFAAFERRCEVLSRMLDKKVENLSRIRNTVNPSSYHPPSPVGEVVHPMQHPALAAAAQTLHASNASGTTSGGAPIASLKPWPVSFSDVLYPHIVSALPVGPLPLTAAEAQPLIRLEVQTNATQLEMMINPHDKKKKHRKEKKPPQSS